jgi:hypothetical protein
MQVKNFVSKKAIIASMVILGVGIGLVAGITYRSAQQQSEQGTAIMPQKTSTSNYTKTADAASPTDSVSSHTTASKTKNKTTISVDCPVKAETNAKGSKVFYLPNMRGYAKVSTTTCFKSAELAAAAGYVSATAK